MTPPSWVLPTAQAFMQPLLDAGGVLGEAMRTGQMPAPAEALQAGTGLAMALMGPKGAGAESAFLRDVRPPRENLDDVVAANFLHGRKVGNRMVDADTLISSMSGAADDAARARALADQMRGPGGYWERPIVDDEGNVIEGQHRVNALALLGVKGKVPVTMVRDAAKGLPLDDMRSAITATGKIHPDHVNQIIGQVADMIHETGSPQAAFNEYEFPPQFRPQFEAALNAAMPRSAYHGTPAVFDKFKVPDSDYMLDRTLGVHLAKDPEVANFMASKGVKKDAWSGAVTMEGAPNVIRAHIPSDLRLLTVDQQPFDWAKDLPDRKPWQAIPSDQSVIEKLVSKEAFQKDPSMLSRYLQQARHVPAADADRIATDLTSGKTATIPNEGDTPYDLDRFVSNYGGKPYNEADRAAMSKLARQSLQEKGYDGLQYINTSPMEMGNATDPTSYVIFDPSKLRSAYSGKNLALGGIAAYGALDHLVGGDDSQ